MTSESLIDQEHFYNLTLPEKHYLLRNLSQKVKDGAIDVCQKGVLIKTLASIYFENEDKDLRRLLSSLWQAFPSQDEEEISDSIFHLVENCLKSSSDDRTIGTSRIEKLSSLLSNFTLGEKNILKCLDRVLGLCIDNLRVLDLKLRDKTKSLTEKDVAMSEVLFNIQFVNKLLNRHLEMEREMENEFNRHQIAEGLKLVCFNLFGFFMNLLNEELYYMDCLIASSIGITLLLKTFSSATEGIETPFISQDSGVSISVKTPQFFREHLVGGRFHQIPITSKICFINAFISVIPINSLTSSTSSSSLSSSLLVSNDSSDSILLVLVQELLGFDVRSMSSNCKLVHSRTLVALSTRIRHHVEATSANPVVNLSCLFSSCSDIFHHLVDHFLHHLDDPTDVIKHQSRISLDNIIFCHIKLEQSANTESVFLHSLVEKHLNDFDWSISNKYSALVCLIKYVGAEKLMLIRPSLIQNLLVALNDQSMACHVTSFFDELWSDSFEGVKKSKGGRVMRDWFEMWVEPILKTLQKGSHNQRTCIAEYLLPKLFMKNEECLEYLISLLTHDGEDGMNLQQVSALVSCLKYDCLKKGNKKSSKLCAQKMNDILSMVIDHQDEQLRLDGFSVLCEHHKTTEVVPINHLRLITRFVEFNLNNQSPSFRQKFSTIMKKLFIRMNESGRFLHKKYVMESKKLSPNVEELASIVTLLQQYKEFLTQLSDLCFKSLHLGSSFPSRTSSLSILILLNQFFSYNQDGDSMLFNFKSALSSSAVFLLLSILGDSFEKNKQDALELLNSLSLDCSSVEEAFGSTKLFKTTLKLSESVRPQDCVTASHLLKFFIHTLTFRDIVTLIKSSGKRSNHFSDLIFNGMLDAIDGSNKVDDGMKNEKCFVIMTWLLARLKHHEGIARSNLLLASATSPMYPVIHCIAKVMATVNWKKVGGSWRWKQLIRELIHTCIDVANVVSVVVNDSSPEGNVPDDLAMSCDLDVPVDFTDAQPFLKNDYESGEEELSGEDEVSRSQKAESKVRLMPEFLVVCSWRSIKETSLILGQISSSVPIISDDNDAGNDQGLLSIDMIHKIGNFFRDQLLQSRHRGAFELAYAGFVQLVRTMWTCSISKLQTLPQIWVEQLMERVKDHDADDLCSTRRSAGVPFFFLAVVSTEPAINDRRILKFVMKNLIGMASEPITSHNTNHVHSRNILRVLFRDSSLGDQVQPFISDGIKVCIEGYNCSYWPVSNSSALLFSILLRRIFGIRKPKAGSQARNLGMSGRAFFTRHPELFEYFLEQLLSLNYDGAVSSIRRGTFLILITLSNLAPSAGENSKSNINIDKLIPHILKCSASKDIKIREMAAKALSSLVSKEQLIKVILDIISGLNKNIELRICDQNYIHGSCLQIQHLMDSTDFYKLLSNDDNGKTSLFELVWGLRALFSDKNPCLVTRYSFGVIIERLLFMPFPNNTKSFQNKLCDFAQILRQNLWQLLKETPSDSLSQFKNLLIDDAESNTHPACRSIAQSSHPFFNQYSSFLVRSNLRYLLSGGNNNVAQFEDLIELLLNSSSGDMQLEILKLLRSLAASCNEHISVESEVGISDDIEDEYEDETCIPEFKVHEWTLSSDRIPSILEPFLTGKLAKMIIQFVAKDVFHLNLIQALQCLIEMLKLSLPVLTFDQITHLFDISTKLSLESHFIAVQEKALCLASQCCYRLFGSRHSDNCVINGMHVDLLKQFCSSVNLRALSENSNTNLKLASSFSLALNYDSLLVDSTGRLGCVVYKNWTSLMHLVQEEDLRVRQMSVSCIPHFQHILGLNHATNLNPTYGSKVLLEIFFQLHCCKKDSSWSVKGLQVLSDWLMLDPIEHQNCQDVRLFDKGELNPYIDEVGEILTIHKTIGHLIHQVQSFYKIYLTNSNGVPREGIKCSLCSEGECQICNKAKIWTDSNKLTSWLNELKRDRGLLENQLKGTNTIEVFTRQSTVQRLIINYLKVTLTANLIMKFTEDGEEVGTNDEVKFSNVENMFNQVKYLMS